MPFAYSQRVSVPSEETRDEPAIEPAGLLAVKIDAGAPVARLETITLAWFSLPIPDASTDR